MKRKKIILENVPVTAYAAEGKALARIEGKVIFIEGAVPGDVVDVLVIKNKKDWAEGKVSKIKEFSPERVTPFAFILAFVEVASGKCSLMKSSYNTRNRK